MLEMVLLSLFGFPAMSLIRTLVFLSMCWSFAGKSGYRVTEKSLMDRLSTDIHEACLKIDKECR